MLADFCSLSNLERVVLSDIEGGRTVVQLSDQAVVKFGYSVMRKEYENQQLARSLVDPTIVWVPEVYRCFSLNDMGYLIMEFINGKPFEELKDTSHKEQLSKALEHFFTV